MSVLRGVVRASQCSEGDVEAALFEAEIVELLADGLGELRDDLAAFGREGLAGAPQVGLELLPSSALMRANSASRCSRLLQFAPGFFAEGDDFGHRRAVFALERMNQVEALFELLQPGGVNVHLLGVAGEFGLQFVQHGRRPARAG